MTNCVSRARPNDAEAVAAVRLEVVHLGVADVAQLGDRAAPGEQRREARDRPEHGAHRRPRLPGVAGEHADDELDDRDTDQLEEPHGSRAPAVSVSIERRR